MPKTLRLDALLKKSRSLEYFNLDSLEGKLGLRPLTRGEQANLRKQCEDKTTSEIEAEKFLDLMVLTCVVEPALESIENIKKLDILVYKEIVQAVLKVNGMEAGDSTEAKRNFPGSDARS